MMMMVEEKAKKGSIFFCLCAISSPYMDPLDCSIKNVVRVCIEDWIDDAFRAIQMVYLLS